MKYCNTAQVYSLKPIGKISCRILLSGVNDDHVNHRRIIVWYFI